MDKAADRLAKVTVYVDNTYEGNLSLDSMDIKSIPWSDWLHIWFNLLSSDSDIPTDCEIGLQLTSDRQIQTLNNQYRSLDKPTDVLAFAATESEIILPAEMSEPLYLGDIIISLDTAARQARSQNHSLVVELAWLASHGVLHLLGWDHPDDNTLRSMLEKQSKLVQSLNIDNKKNS